MMSMVKQPGLILALLAPLSPLAAQNLIANGGFETGDFTNWTTAQNTTSRNVQGGGFQSGGDWAARIGDNANPGGNGNGLVTLSQGFATTRNTRYTVAFDWKNTVRGGSFEVFLNFRSIFNPPNVVSPWRPFAQAFVVDSENSLIQFVARHPDGFWGIDNVSVTIAAVPEPKSWALLITGFGLVGATLRTARRPART